MTLDEAKDLKWGTYGKHPSGDIWLLGIEPMRIVTLGECDTEHLCNILITQTQIPLEYREACRMIVNDRLEEMAK